MADPLQKKACKALKPRMKGDPSPLAKLVLELLEIAEEGGFKDEE